MTFSWLAVLKLISPLKCLLRNCPPSVVFLMDYKWMLRGNAIIKIEAYRQGLVEPRLPTMKETFQITNMLEKLTMSYQER